MTYGTQYMVFQEYFCLGVSKKNAGVIYTDKVQMISLSEVSYSR
jgi:hypothetical protein